MLDNSTCPKTFNKCPECGEPLEATVPCYLSDVVVDEDGYIISYRVAFGDSYDQTSKDSPLGDALNLDDPTEARVYCPDDHPFDVTAAQSAKG